MNKKIDCEEYSKKVNNNPRKGNIKKETENETKLNHK